MQWTVEKPGIWKATIEVLNQDFLDSLHFAVMSTAVSKNNIDPETEIKHIIQYELALELFKRYNNGKNFYDVIQDVIDFYEQRK